VSFGRQKNLVRRAVRPDGRFARETRRRNASKATLLDAGSGPPPLSVRLAKMVAKLFGR
jgi:hypothetical protein